MEATTGLFSKGGFLIILTKIQIRMFLYGWILTIFYGNLVHYWSLCITRLGTLLRAPPPNILEICSFTQAKLSKGGIKNSLWSYIIIITKKYFLLLLHKVLEDIAFFHRIQLFEDKNCCLHFKVSPIHIGVWIINIF